MQVLNLFYAVASMVSGLRLSHFFAFPDVYHLALARVESVICGPPALSPYLNFVCGTVDAVRPTVESSPVVVNLNFNIADFDSAFSGLSVFDPSLINCTLVDEPVYFGPHLPPADIIVAPKFALLSLEPRSPPDDEPQWEGHGWTSEPPIYDWIRALFTLDNFVLLARLFIAYQILSYIVSCIKALVRWIFSLICRLYLALRARLYPPTLHDLLDDLANGRLKPEIVNGPTLLDLAGFGDPRDPLINRAATIEPVVPIVEEQVAPVAEELVVPVITVDELEPDSAPTQEEVVVVVAEVSTDQDDEACEDVAQPVSSSIVDEAAKPVVDDDLSTHASPPPVVVADIEAALDVQAIPTIASVDEPSESSLLPAPQVQQPMDIIPPSEAVPPPIASSSALLVDAAETTEQPEQRPKKPVRCGKRLKMLRRKLAREAAEAEAAAQAQSQPATPEAPPPVPPVEEQQTPWELLTRQEKRAHRTEARAARLAAGPSSSRAVREQPPRAPTSVFTDADFPPLPVEPVASRPLEHKMSYALITAISPASKTAAVRRGSWTVKVNTDPELEPSGSKWIASSRRYEDSPTDSRWTNWKVNLEDIATFKPARKSRRSRGD